MSTVSDDLTDTLAAAGVKRIFGIAGDSLNPVMEALHEDKRIRWVNVRHEETGAFAASAEAQLTGRLAACCGSCGPGNMHLINGLYDAYRSGAPVFALASHIPQSLIGSGYFQETHPTKFFTECTRYCDLVGQAAQARQVFASAVRYAEAYRGVGMAVLPGDVAAMESAEPLPAPPAFPAKAPQARCEPATEDIAELAERLLHARSVTFFCGEGCRRGRNAIVELALKLNAPIAYTLRAKDFMERDNPNAIGMTGLIGWGDATNAIQSAELLVLWGTDFPYSCFLPDHGRVVQVDTDAAVLGRRARLCQAVHGDAGRVAELLLPHIPADRPDDFLATCLSRYGKALTQMNNGLGAAMDTRPMRPEYITRVVNQHAEPDAVFCIDTGTPVMWAARYLQAQARRRIIGSFKHGSMACALAMAIGAKAAFPSRQVIAMCGDGGLSMLPGDLLTLLQEGLSAKVFVYNNSALDFVAMEQANARMEPMGTALIPTDYAAIARAIGLEAFKLTDPAQAADTVRQWLGTKGPALLDATVDTHALAQPPDTSVVQALGYALKIGQRVLHSELDAIKRALFGSRKVFR